MNFPSLFDLFTSTPTPSSSSVSTSPSPKLTTMQPVYISITQTNNAIFNYHIYLIFAVICVAILSFFTYYFYKKRFPKVNRNIDVNDGLNNGLRKCLNYGLNNDLNHDLNQGLNNGLNQGLNNGLNQGLNNDLNQGLNHGLNQGLNYDLNYDLSTNLNYGLNNSFNCGLNNGIKKEFNNDDTTEKIQFMIDNKILNKSFVIAWKNKNFLEIN